MLDPFRFWQNDFSTACCYSAILVPKKKQQPLNLCQGGSNASMLFIKLSLYFGSVPSPSVPAVVYCI